MTEFDKQHGYRLGPLSEQYHKEVEEIHWKYAAALQRALLDVGFELADGYCVVDPYGCVLRLWHAAQPVHITWRANEPWTLKARYHDSTSRAVSVKALYELTVKGLARLNKQRQERAERRDYVD